MWKLCKKCPVEAIDKNTFLTNGEKCISCFACVKCCTKNARVVENPKFSKLVEKLENHLRYVEKDAEIFF